MLQATTALPVRADFTDLDNDELVLSVVRHYHERMHESPAALKYLETRGINDTELIDRCQIGFVDRTLGRQFPSHQLKAGAQIRKRLKSIGMLKSSGHELFRGCIVVPFFNDDGHVVQLYGQRIDNVAKGTDREIWLRDHEPHKLPEELQNALQPETVPHDREAPASDSHENARKPGVSVPGQQAFSTNAVVTANGNDVHVVFEDWKRTRVLTRCESTSLPRAMISSTWTHSICANPGRVLPSSERI